MANALYLMFNGNCEEAINYYKDKLGGNLISMQRYGEAPAGQSSESYKDKIMHARAAGPFMQIIPLPRVPFIT